MLYISPVIYLLASIPYKWNGYLITITNWGRLQSTLGISDPDAEYLLLFLQQLRKSTSRVQGAREIGALLNLTLIRLSSCHFVFHFPRVQQALIPIPTPNRFLHHTVVWLYKWSEVLRPWACILAVIRHQVCSVNYINFILKQAPCWKILPHYWYSKLRLLNAILSRGIFDLQWFCWKCSSILNWGASELVNTSFQPPQLLFAFSKSASSSLLTPGGQHGNEHDKTC